MRVIKRSHTFSLAAKEKYAKERPPESLACDFPRLAVV